MPLLFWFFLLNVTAVCVAFTPGNFVALRVYANDSVVLEEFSLDNGPSGAAATMVSSTWLPLQANVASFVEGFFSFDEQGRLWVAGRQDIMVSDQNGQFSVTRSGTSGNNIRSVCANGTHYFWTTGNGVFVGAGSAASSQLRLVDGTPRFAAIFDRRLYVSSDKDLERLGEDGAFSKILTPNATDLCSFFFAKLGGGSEVDTLWMTASGSLVKFSLVNGVWSQDSNGLAVPGGPRGLHGRVTSSGVELLISAGQSLYLYRDSLTPGAHMMGATMPLFFASGAKYRGIAFVPTTTAALTSSSSASTTTTSSSTVQTTATDADLLTTTRVSSTSTQIDPSTTSALVVSSTTTISSSTVQTTATDTDLLTTTRVSPTSTPIDPSTTSALAVSSTTTTSSSTVQTTATDADLLTTTRVSPTSTPIDPSTTSALVVSSSPLVDNTAFIAGVAAGSAAGALLLAGLVAFCVCRAKRSRSEQEEVRVIPVDFELSDVARSNAVYGRVPDSPYDVVSLPATHVYDAPESTLSL
jgi:hypothetical protein